MLSPVQTPVETEHSSHEIDVVDKISPTDFLHKYIHKNRPLLMRQMMSEWGARQRWSLEFFHQMASDQQVLLEEGNVMQGETGFRSQSFKDFVGQLMQSKAGDGKTAYLSVFRLFDEFPELRKDVDFSLLDQHKIKSSTVGWIGPAGTVTGFHIDWGDNILAQIAGRKLLHLVAPAESAKMYPSKKFDQGTTISQVDLENYDAEKFPEFAEARKHRIVLQPGEMIFIPRGWWHHVRSLDVSISVSNIGYDLRGILFDAIPHRLKQKLHNAGLWKCDCTCHVVRDGKWCRK